MTGEEAIKKLNAIKKYLTAGNPIWDVKEIEEVLDMAIEALTEPKTIIGIDIPYGSDKGIATIFKAADGKINLEEIEEIKPVKHGEWIPVSERLPENGDWVIVTILDENGDTSYKYTDFGWYLKAANCWIVDAEPRTDVTAWMSLPKPYREDSER